MVRNESKTTYECTYCNEEYDNYDDANDCAKDCASSDYDEPKEINIDKYVCEICNESYETEREAENCEEDHTENQDSYYEEHQRQQELLRLTEAANVKEQNKITKYIL